MAITLITGPANSGKAELVLDAVRRHMAHGEEPLLIVPTRADVEHYLRELAAGETAVGVRVERFGTLIAETVRRAGMAERVIGPVARERLLGTLIARTGVTATGRGLVRALGELLAELQLRRVSTARLRGALASWAAADGPGVSRAELGELLDAYRGALQRLSLADEEQRAVHAFDALREQPALWGRTPVLFYGFDDLTKLQLDAIETLGRVVGADVTVSLAYEPGRTAFAGRASSFHELAPLAAEHRALPARAEHYSPHARAALSHLERSLFEPGGTRVNAGTSIRLLEGGGERAELELVGAEIVALLDRGTAADQIAVLARPAGTSPELLEEVFAQLDIPFAAERQRAARDTAIGRALIGLLRCVPGADGTIAGELGDLLAWLRAPGLLENPALADSLELRARRSGALSAEQARSLWEQRQWPLQTIDRLAEAQQRGPAALCELASRELQRLFCAPRRALASVLAADELDEAGALAVLGGALGELRELGRGAADLAPAGAAELAQVLSGVELFSGERPVAGAVAVLDPLALRARRVSVLFVCGLQEGAFPVRSQSRPLLSEDERRRLAEVSGLVLDEQQDVLAAERYLLYAAVSRPQEQLVLSWHVADDDGEAISRSLFVDDVCDLFDESLLRERRRRALGAVDALPAAGRGRSGSHPDEPLGNQGLLGGLREHVWSASSLERWIGCPVSWFVQRMLRPDAFEPEPEPLARGGLAHAALKDTLEGLRQQTGTARVTAATLARAQALLATALAANEAEYPLSVAPERSAAVRRRLQADLERYLAHAAATHSSLQPSELELSFGFTEGDDHGEPSTLPALDLGAGMRLRGRIDRIDVGERGEAVVYDYKGARAPAAARWISDGNVQVALYMRAVEQLLQLEVVGGFYQPLAGEDLRARGVLNGESDAVVPCVKTDVRDGAELRELLEAAVAAARAAADQAGRGELQARPQTCAFRGGCMYPTICRCER